MKRFTGVLLLLLAGWLILGLPSSAASQGGTVVRVHPAEVTLEPGESEIIEIWVDDVVGLFGFEIRIYFIPTLISVGTLSLGDLLEPGMNPINEVDNVNGFLRYDMSQLGEDVQSQDGSGVLISFEITRLDPTTEPKLIIGTVLLTDRDGVEIPCENLNGFTHSLFLPLILR